MTNPVCAPPRSARLFQLDALRGVGAVTVVVFHLTILWEQEAKPTSPAARFLLGQIAPLGAEAIIFFFLLSGFVLSLSAIDGRPQGYSNFVIRRVFRIYVPYLVAIAAAVAGAFWLHGPITQSVWFRQFWSEPVDWRLVGQHVLFVGAYNTDQFNNPIWSLVQEMRVSLIFPALCWLVLRFRSRWSLAIAAAFSAIGVLLNKAPVPAGWLAHDTFQITGLFVFGILFARERERFGTWYRRLPRFARLPAGLVSLWVFFLGGSRLTWFAGHLFGRASMDVSQWITALGAGGIVTVSLNSAWLQRALASPSMRFLASISYSLYLWHFVVLLYCVHLLYGRMPFAAILCLAFVLMFPVSWCSFRWVELPSNALGRRLGGIRLKHMPPQGANERRFAAIGSADPNLGAASVEAVADTSAA